MPPKNEQLQPYKWCIIHTNLDEWYMGKVDHCGFMGKHLNIMLKPLLKVEKVKSEKIDALPWKVIERTDKYLFTFDGCIITEWKKAQIEISEIVILASDHTVIILSSDAAREDTIKPLIDQ